jgi:hypothetical protein
MKSRVTMLLVALAMITVGCGDDATPTTGGLGATPTTADGTPGTDAPPSGGGTNLAVIQIGDNRYEVDVTPGAIQRCNPDFFGAFWVIGFTSEDMSATLEMLLSPENREELGMEEPRIRVMDPETEIDWRADPDYFADTELSAGMSQVDSFTVDGNRVTGTATFIDGDAANAALFGNGEMPEPVQGTFEVVCSG